jgi:cytochrome c biogenesis protein CcmG/thiol:disulfide interchange protein DsbE
LIALIVGAVVVITRPSTTPAFEASGAPISAPPLGQLTDVSADQFEGVLVGLRGTPVIVNVWASWCAPCRTETPLLQRTWQARGDDVVILGVNSRDRRSSAESFMDEFDVTFANVFDESGQIRRRLGVRGFPSTYVFGADGKLRTTVVGALTEQRLASILADVTS